MPYLDNAATTPLEPRVLEKMMPYLTGVFGNPSSIHRFGQEAKKAIETAHREVASFVGAEPREVIFTSGGTEADNMALWGIARANAPTGGHLILSAIEHHAVLHTGEEMARAGYAVDVVKPGPDGRLRAEDVAALIRPDTFLISVMWANNETGAVQPVAELAALARERGLLFHSDAVQAAGHLPVRMDEVPVSSIALAAHKLSGPKGTGALVIRSGVKISPLIVGGAHERGRRAGTENVAGIVGFAEACRLWRIEGQARQARLDALGDRLAGGLSAISGARRHGPGEGGMRHIVNVGFDGVDGETLLLNLDLMGVAASSGSACTSGSLDPSHVLLAMGLSREEAQGAVRFSLGIQNTEEDVDEAVRATAASVERMRSLLPSPGREVRSS